MELFESKWEGKQMDCFLDGITDCNHDKTCEQCKREEEEWVKKWGDKAILPDALKGYSAA